MSNFKSDGNSLVRDKSSLESQLERMRSELEKYKKNALTSMNILLQEVSKEEPTTDRIVENVFDYDLSMVQVQTLTYIKQLKDNFETRVNNFNETIRNMAAEIEHLKHKNTSL